MTKYFALFLIIIGSFWQSNLFAAQIDPKILPQATLARSQLMEQYSGKAGANVSGALLVGATLGKNPLIEKNANVILASPPKGDSKNLCLRVTTRDGLFWSDNPYKTPESDSFSISTGPVANRFLNDLQKYPAEDIMVKAIVPFSDNCSTPTKDNYILPAMGQPDGYLYIYLLTGGNAAGVRIKKAEGTDDPEKKSVCEKLSPGSLVAVDKVCKIEFPADMPPGRYNLDVRIKGRIGTEDHSFSFYNPNRIK